ncbi:hypothetical protein ACQ4WX_36285 [Streptomyces lasalocidi]
MASRLDQVVARLGGALRGEPVQEPCHLGEGGVRLLGAGLLGEDDLALLGEVRLVLLRDAEHPGDHQRGQPERETPYQVDRVGTLFDLVQELRDEQFDLGAQGAGAAGGELGQRHPAQPAVLRVVHAAEGHHAGFRRQLDPDGEAGLLVVGAEPVVVEHLADVRVPGHQPGLAAADPHAQRGSFSQLRVGVGRCVGAGTGHGPDGEF